jgi:serine/threonine-protein kinase HipA
MKQAAIYMHDQLAGRLWQDEDGYHFEYDAAYLQNETSEAISRTFPLQHEVFHNGLLFPFFDGLIPEGWLLTIAQQNWKLNPRNRMELLLACCKDCIGAVSIQPLETE